MKVLHFSGGIDSLACLLLLKDEPGLNVLTVQTDGGYPSVESYLMRLRERLPQLQFHVIHSDREIPRYGHPVDVVPLRWTAIGQMSRGGTDVRYQDFYSCCRRAIWAPLQEMTAKLGATTVYRGQRNDDRLRAPIRDGYVENGVIYRFPIATWTRNMVLKYVGEHAHDLMPPGYAQGERTSRDCMDCTAYLQDNHERILNLPNAVFKHVNTILTQWRQDVLSELGD